MAKLKYSVELKQDEIALLKEVISKGISSAKEILHANILLATDDTRVPKLTVAQVAQNLNTTATTVQAIRKNYATKGFDAALKRKKRDVPPVAPKITGDVEAHVVALACSEAPHGYSKWSLRLLASKAIELEYIDSISCVSVDSILKNTT